MHQRRMIIQENVSLKPYNTFQIEARAKMFAEINSVDELKQIVKHPVYAQMPKLILGGGSNVLFTQDFDGLVLKINIPGIEVIREDEESVWLKTGAGVNWHELVVHCIALGYGGIENLSLIPGTVGAAPMQNIGAYGVEIKDTFDSLEAVHIQTGEVKIFNSQDCQFGYRESIFKTILKDQYIITYVTLKLSKYPVVNISYGAIEETLAQMRSGNGSDKSPGIKEVSEAVIYIRQSKLPDPKAIGNAGSFFKNPVVSLSQYEQLKHVYNKIPAYELPDNTVKIPAGWLIEQAGWRGKRIGQVGVHDKQALVLVNHGGGVGEEIKALALQIQQSVYDKFGIELMPEVNII